MLIPLCHAANQKVQVTALADDHLTASCRSVICIQRSSRRGRLV